MPAKKTWLCNEAAYREMRREGMGVCLSCGNAQHGAEPDAEGIECDSCGESRVMGVESAFVSGRLKIVEKDFDDIPEKDRVRL